MLRSLSRPLKVRLHSSTFRGRQGRRDVATEEAREEHQVEGKGIQAQEEHRG